LQGFLQIVKEIPTLPVAPLAESLIKRLENNVSATVLQMVKLALAEGRLSTP